MGEIFQTLLSNGHKLDDLRYYYTIDQVYLLYEKCKKSDLDQQRLDAITLAQALVYASPSVSSMDSSKKQKGWNRFLDSLDWDLMENKTKQDPLKAFAKAGIPIKKKGEKKDG